MSYIFEYLNQDGIICTIEFNKAPCLTTTATAEGIGDMVGCSSYVWYKK